MHGPTYFTFGKTCCALIAIPNVDKANKVEDKRKAKAKLALHVIRMQQKR